MLAMTCICQPIVIRELLFRNERSPFLAIQLSPHFDLTMKLQNQESLAIQLSKPFILDHRLILVSSFVDVDDKQRWGHMSSLFFLFLLASSSLFLSRFSFLCRTPHVGLHNGGGWRRRHGGAWRTVACNTAPRGGGPSAQQSAVRLLMPRVPAADSTLWWGLAASDL